MRGGVSKLGGKTNPIDSDPAKFGRRLQVANLNLQRKCWQGKRRRKMKSDRKKRSLEPPRRIFQEFVQFSPVRFGNPLRFVLSFELRTILASTTENTHQQFWIWPLEVGAYVYLERSPVHGRTAVMMILLTQPALEIQYTQLRFIAHLSSAFI